MRKPDIPPDWRRLASAPERAGRLPGILSDPALAPFDGPYYHWEDLKHRPLPPGYSREDVWVRLKMARAPSYRALPLTDGQGRAFVFSLPDCLLRRLQEIDALSGNGIRAEAPILPPGARGRYPAQSLMEEAIASSLLEGAPTTRAMARDMFLSGRAPANLGERMALGNFRAMEEIRRDAASPLTVGRVLALHRILTEGTLDRADAAGRFRREDEQIGVMDFEGTVYHRPPACGEKLKERMAAIVAFANRGPDPGGVFLPAALRAVILHFALAYEHPFVDGNGRVARSLMYWSMLRGGYDVFRYVAISDILRRAPAKYAAAYLYTETDGGDLTYFMLHQTGVVLAALQSLKRFAARKEAEAAEVAGRLPADAALNFRQRSLLARLIKHPGSGVSVAGYCRFCGVSYATGRSDLTALRGAGLLSAHRDGRATIYRLGPDAARGG